MSALERRKCSQQKQECHHAKRREYPPLKAARLPKHLSIAQRVEPQQVNPEGERGAAAEHNDGNDGDENQQSAAVMSPLA